MYPRSHRGGGIHAELGQDPHERLAERPWVIQRAVTSVRASLGYAMRGEDLPAFPGKAELRDQLGEGDGSEDPLGPLRLPRFHPGP